MRRILPHFVDQIPLDELKTLPRKNPAVLHLLNLLASELFARRWSEPGWRRQNSCGHTTPFYRTYTLPVPACHAHGTLTNMPRRAILLLTLCLVVFAAEPNAATKRWWSHVVALSGDDLQGRDYASDGYKKAARYVVTQFEKAGLKPAGEHGYSQTVPMHELRFVPEKSSVELVRPEGTTKLQWLRQIGITAREGLPDKIQGPIVFMGEAGGDASGKIVVALNGHAPRNAQGALAVVTIDNLNAIEPPRWPIQYARAVRLRETAAGPGRGGPPTMRFNPADAELLFAGSGHTYKELYAITGPLPTFPLNGALKASLAFTTLETESDNILAVLPGSDPVLSKEYVVISAHLDGYGLGEPWLINGKTDNIYNGAFDDAAYVATLIDFAEALKAAHQTTKRSILFCVVTAEEKGLLGSKYYAAHPTIPPAQMVANINLDQLRPIFPLKILTMLAVNESNLGETAKAVAASMDIRIQADPEPGRNLLRRSDHWNFMQIGVPSTGFIFGFEKGTPDEAAYREWYAKRYHSPLDDLNQPWLPEAAAKFNDFFAKLVTTIADAPEKPHSLPGSQYAPKN